MLRRALRFVRDGAIIVALAVALVVLVEVGLRLYFGPPGYELDAQRITALAPNVTKVYVRSVDGGPRFLRWSTNQDGFRGPALESSPDLRVIVYGDSNVQARFSKQADSFTGQLDTMLEELLDDSVEVINAITKAYKLLVRRRVQRDDALQQLEPLVQKFSEVRLFVDFLLSSSRGIVK